MIAKKILNPERIRRIEGGFGFIPHRLITEGFVAALDTHELLVKGTWGRCFVVDIGKE